MLGRRGSRSGGGCSGGRFERHAPAARGSWIDEVRCDGATTACGSEMCECSWVARSGGLGEGATCSDESYPLGGAIFDDWKEWPWYSIAVGEGATYSICNRKASRTKIGSRELCSDDQKGNAYCSSSHGTDDGAPASPLLGPFCICEG